MSSLRVWSRALALGLLVSVPVGGALGVSPASAAAKPKPKVIKTCVKKPAAPDWAFVPPVDSKALSRLSLCTRGEGSTFIVEVENTTRYGVVLSYGAPVKFGYSARGFGLPTLTRMLNTPPQPDGLYLAPKSKGSFGLTPGLSGPVTFTAKPTLMTQWLDKLIAYTDIGGDALLEVLVNNSGCANLMRGALTADLASSLGDVAQAARDGAPALAQCISELEKHLAKQAIKGPWRSKIKKIAKFAIKYDKLLKLMELSYSQTRQILAYASPGYVTVVPKDRLAPFSPPTGTTVPVTQPAPAPAPSSSPTPVPDPTQTPIPGPTKTPVPGPTQKPVPEPTAPPTAPAAKPDRMSMDARLNAASNDFLQSPDGRFRFVMQQDGNLVLYAPSGPIWTTSTVGRGANHLRMQGDGNLVMYNGSDKPIWSSNTPRRYNAYLVIQNDGNVVIYNDGQAIWSTGTGGRT